MHVSILFFCSKKFSLKSNHLHVSFEGWLGCYLVSLWMFLVAVMWLLPAWVTAASYDWSLVYTGHDSDTIFSPFVLKERNTLILTTCCVHSCYFAAINHQHRHYSELKLCLNSLHYSFNIFLVSLFSLQFSWRVKAGKGVSNHINDGCIPFRCVKSF